MALTCYFADVGRSFILLFSALGSVVRLRNMGFAFDRCLSLCGFSVIEIWVVSLRLGRGVA